MFERGHDVHRCRLCVAACKIKNDGHSVTVVGFNRTAPNSSCVTVIATVTRTRARPVAVCFVCLVYVCFDHDPLTYSKTDDHHHTNNLDEYSSGAPGTGITLASTPAATYVTYKDSYQMSLALTGLTTSTGSTASEETHESKSSGVQGRINDLTAKRYKEERRANEAEQELAKLKAISPQIALK